MRRIEHLLKEAKRVLKRMQEQEFLMPTQETMAISKDILNMFRL
jgi:hypothetical protein